jgi:hypothetical protein
LREREQKRLKNLPAKYFLEAGNDDLKKIATLTYNELLLITQQQTISQTDVDRFANTIRERIKPYNTAGLFEPSSENMYHHTVAKL